MSSVDEYARQFGVILPEAYAEYKIFTKYGNWYIINNKGQVLETSNGLNKRSAPEKTLSNWVITGAWKRSAFGRTSYISLKGLTELTEFLYMNGNPIYGLTGRNHGIDECNGNMQVNGVVGISKIV